MNEEERKKIQGYKRKNELRRKEKDTRIKERVNEEEKKEKTRIRERMNEEEKN